MVDSYPLITPHRLMGYISHSAYQYIWSDIEGIPTRSTMIPFQQSYLAAKIPYQLPDSSRIPSKNILLLPLFLVLVFFLLSLYIPISLNSSCLHILHVFTSSSPPHSPVPFQSSSSPPPPLSWSSFVLLAILAVLSSPHIPSSFSIFLCFFFFFFPFLSYFSSSSSSSSSSSPPLLPFLSLSASSPSSSFFFLFFFFFFFFFFSSSSSSSSSSSPPPPPPPLLLLLLFFFHGYLYDLLKLKCCHNNFIKTCFFGCCFLEL